MFFLLGSEFGLIAFIFNNYDKIDELKLILSTIALFILLLSITIIAIYLKREIDKLEEINE